MSAGGVNLTAHIYLVPGLGVVQLYPHSLIRFHRLGLN